MYGCLASMRRFLHSRSHGFFPFILPYLEEVTLAEMYQWEFRSQGPENQPVATTQLKVLQCPSAVPDRWIVHIA